MRSRRAWGKAGTGDGLPDQVENFLLAIREFGGHGNDPNDGPGLV
ncbi:hypothetical protein D558_3929 [Bordetella holmesii 44057]|nr:hypothetical protein D558_3929 [Bordetella holmesii 44057]